MRDANRVLSFSLETLAEQIGAKLEPSAAALQPVYGVATLEAARAGHIGFYANSLYRNALQTTQAAAVIISPKEQALCPVPVLLMDNPYLGYALAARLFNPPPSIPASRDPSAWISPEAQLADNVSVGPHALIEAGACLAEGVIIGAGCVIERGVTVGANSELRPRVTLCRDTQIGTRVLIHPGVVIGSDGFGFANDQGRWVKVPQLGRVIIGDDVEIGANTTIDRGALDDTRIENGAKLDNQIQIAHNVVVGEHTAIAGCVGIAGSTHIGRRCMIGGGVGIVGHITIVDDVYISGGSVVLQGIDEAGLYSSGSPLQLNKDWHKNYLRFKQLNEFARRLSQLEKKLTG